MRVAEVKRVNTATKTASEVNRMNANQCPQSSTVYNAPIIATKIDQMGPNAIKESQTNIDPNKKFTPKNISKLLRLPKYARRQKHPPKTARYRGERGISVFTKLLIGLPRRSGIGVPGVYEMRPAIEFSHR